MKSALLLITALTMTTGLVAVSTAIRAAENVTLTDVSVDDGVYHLTLPSATIAASSLGQKDFEALGKGGGALALIGRAGDLAATSVTIPAATLEIRKGVGDPRPGGRVEVKDLVLSGLKSGVASGLTVGAVTIEADGARTSLAKASAKGLDLVTALRWLLDEDEANAAPRALVAAATVETLTLRGKRSDVTVAKLDATDLRHRSPAAGIRLPALFGRLALHEVAFLPPSSAAGTPADVTIRDAEFRLDDPVDGLPSTLAVKIGALRPSSALIRAKGLADLGYDVLSLDAVVSAKWNAETSEATIDTVSLSGDGIGAVTLSGTFAGVKREDLLNLDHAHRFAATTLKASRVVVENKGLFEHLVAREAKASGRPLDEVRAKMSDKARATILTLMGRWAGGPVVEAALKFVTRPGKLTVASTSKAPGGAPLADLSKKAPDGTPGFATAMNVTAAAE